MALRRITVKPTEYKIERDAWEYDCARVAVRDHAPVTTTSTASQEGLTLIPSAYAIYSGDINNWPDWWTGVTLVGHLVTANGTRGSRSVAIVDPDNVPDDIWDLLVARVRTVHPDHPIAR